MSKKNKQIKIRVRIDWNTGERAHKQKKGKGSYNRRKGVDK